MSRLSVARRIAAGIGLVSVLAVVPSVTGTAAAVDTAVVTTESGRLRGVVDGDHRSYQGIPYAAPPVGALRWGSPRPPAPWAGVRDASQPASSCPQALDPPAGIRSDNEDCLYLNVTTPREVRGRRLPVMVWIHGGDFAFGAASILDAAPLAATGDVVVVTINYRLGVFGFLAHPALDGGAAPNLSGNFGLEDQQAALRWVRRNVSAFGGDPGNVTVFGESAGGHSVCAQLTSPGAAGLFHRAIAQSYPCAMPPDEPGTPSSGDRPRQTAEQQGAAVAARLGCDDPATAATCLRAKPVSEVMAAAGQGFGFGPVIGGPVLPLAPVEALAAGRFSKVPVMQGINRDEERFMVAGAELQTGHVLTDAEYPQRITALFGERAPAVLARYPRGHYGSASEALATVLTDSRWALGAVDSARLLSRRVPTYAYEFADARAPWFRGAPLPSFPLGAYHTAELPYLFTAGYADPLSRAQQRLSRQLIAYWTRFARSGNPNGPATPAWREFRNTTRYVQSLAPDEVGAVDLAREHHYPFWKSLDE